MKIVTGRRVFWIFMLILGVLYFGSYFRKYDQVDTCSDRGGCWDHDREGCVWVAVLGRELEPMPWQESGQCHPPGHDESYKRYFCERFGREPQP